jgi:hypothetical protein
VSLHSWKLLFGRLVTTTRVATQYTGALLDSAMEMAGRGRAAVERKHTTAAAAVTTAAAAVNTAADGPMSSAKKAVTGPLQIGVQTIAM